MRRWHTALGQRTGPVRTRQAYSLVRGILNTAVGDALIASNPCQIRGAGQVRSAERPLLSLAEIEKLALSADSWMGPIITVTFWTHLRLGEVLGLRWSDVDLVGAKLHVRRQVLRTASGLVEGPPKAASVRTVHLASQAVDVLQALLATGQTDTDARVFAHPSGRVLQHNHVQKAWERARVAVGRPEVHFHDVRHAGLTFAAQAGASIKDLMARGGHSTMNAAMIYQHAAESRDRELAERMSKLASRSE